MLLKTRKMKLVCLLFAQLVGVFGRVDHNVPVEEVQRLFQLEADLSLEEETSSMPLALKSTFQDFRRIFGDQAAVEDLFDHPINLFLLYRHWSASLSVWKRSFAEFPEARLLEMIELAPKPDDVQGSIFYAIASVTKGRTGPP